MRRRPHERRAADAAAAAAAAGLRAEDLAGADIPMPKRELSANPLLDAGHSDGFDTCGMCANPLLDAGHSDGFDTCGMCANPLLVDRVMSRQSLITNH